jgi:hypothetical protein
VLPLLLGLFLIVASSVVKVIRVARTAEVPVAMRGGAVMAWVFGTLAIAVLPAFAALAILDLATDLVRLDGGLEQLGAAMLWVGICDVANIGRLVSPKPEERGTDVDLTKDRRLLFLVAMMATVAYAVALLIAVGFVDDGHVALGVAIALGFVASAATIQARPGGPGMGPLTRRPIDPDGATEDRPDGDRRFGAGPDGDDDRAAGDDDRATRDDDRGTHDAPRATDADGRAVREDRDGPGVREARGGGGSGGVPVATARPAASNPRRALAVVLAAIGLALATAGPAGAAQTVRRCGTIAVPSTQARAAVSLRGKALACTTVKRVVRKAYERSVLLADTRPFTVRDDGRSFRCRYTPSTGAIVCEGGGRRLRGTI